MTRSGPPGTELEIVEDELDEVVPAEAEGFSALILTAASMILIVLAPFATSPQPAGKGWYLAPIAWPLVSLGMAIVAGAALSWQFLKAFRGARDRKAFRTKTLWAFGGLVEAFEYALYFCVYMVAVSYLGFAIATLLFLEFVIWRAGLRGTKWVLTGLFTTVAIVVIFRVGIGLWFPLAPLFKLLPDWVGNTFGSFL